MGSDLKELKTLEDAGSVHEARATLNRLLAAQEQERRRWRKIAEETRHLQYFQADHQRLIGDSKEFEIVMQSAEQVIITARATIAKAEALIKINK